VALNVHKESFGVLQNLEAVPCSNAASVKKAGEIFKKQCNHHKQEKSARRVGTYPHPQESHTASIHTIFAEV
jgi:hypothetical protein